MTDRTMIGILCGNVWREEVCAGQRRSSNAGKREEVVYVLYRNGTVRAYPYSGTVQCKKASTILNRGSAIVVERINLDW